MNILGIDPGLRNTGWAVLLFNKNHDEIFFKDGGIITTNNNLPILPRLARIGKALNDIILSFKPERTVIESVFMNSNGKSSMDLSHARGAILYILSQHMNNIVEYQATTIKKNITGNGHSTKEQVRQNLFHYVKDIPSNNKKHDIYDAISIALCNIFASNIDC